MSIANEAARHCVKIYRQSLNACSLTENCSQQCNTMAVAVKAAILGVQLDEGQRDLPRAGMLSRVQDPFLEDAIAQALETVTEQNYCTTVTKRYAYAMLQLPWHPKGSVQRASMRLTKSAKMPMDAKNQDLAAILQRVSDFDAGCDWPVFCDLWHLVAQAKQKYLESKEVKSFHESMASQLSAMALQMSKQATIEMRLGHHDDAYELLEAALGLQPGMQTLRKQMKQLRVSLGLDSEEPKVVVGQVANTEGTDPLKTESLRVMHNLSNPPWKFTHEQWCQLRHCLWRTGGGGTGKVSGKRNNFFLVAKAMNLSSEYYGVLLCILGTQSRLLCEAFALLLTKKPLPPDKKSGPRSGRAAQAS